MALQEKDKVISATFVTLEGHIEKGIINFTITDLGNSQMKFEISSISEVDQGTAKAVAEGYSRDEQKKSWDEVLGNFVEKSEGLEEERTTEVGKEEAELETGGEVGGGGASDSY